MLKGFKHRSRHTRVVVFGPPTRRELNQTLVKIVFIGGMIRGGHLVPTDLIAWNHIDNPMDKALHIGSRAEQGGVTQDTIHLDSACGFNVFEPNLTRSDRTPK